MDLFEYAKSKTLDRESPLASRLRPTTLDEVVGQEHIVGNDKLLYRAINELLSLSQRFEVAKMLTDKRTYLDISEKNGASTATISRVNRSLNYGNDGYEMVFSRMKEKETAGKTEE